MADGGGRASGKMKGGRGARGEGRGAAGCKRVDDEWVETDLCGAGGDLYTHILAVVVLAWFSEVYRFLEGGGGREGVASGSLEVTSRRPDGVSVGGTYRSYRGYSPY